MADSTLSGWLALREGADAAARRVDLVERLVRVLPPARPLRIVDLGSGSGSNVRYLTSRLPEPQEWLTVDKDAALLEEGRRRTRVNGRIETRTIDLGAMRDGDLFHGRHLVTASALLDLVSEPWLRWVAAACRTEGAAALFTLTYDGRNNCTPADPDDDAVFALFNGHQRTDKGLAGQAAGPRGAEVAAACFAGEGFQVHLEPSEWRLDAAQRDLQTELIDGWAAAAAEMAPARLAWLTAWRQRRLAHVDAGRSRIVVGHQDLLAYRDDVERGRSDMARTPPSDGRS